MLSGDGRQGSQRDNFREVQGEGGLSATQSLFELDGTNGVKKSRSRVKCTGKEEGCGSGR